MPIHMYLRLCLCFICTLDKLLLLLALYFKIIVKNSYGTCNVILVTTRVVSNKLVM